MLVDSGVHAACGRLAMIAAQKHAVPVNGNTPDGHIVFEYTVSQGAVCEKLRLAFPVAEVTQNDSVRSVNETFSHAFSRLELQCHQATELQT